MARTLVANARLLATLDDAGRRLPGGSVLIEDGAVEAVFEAGAAPAPAPDWRVLDAAGLLVTPGLVNTHHHLYQTLTRNLPAAQDVPLFPWLRTHYEIWRALTAEALETATRTALAQLMLSGCTLTSDHQYLFPKDAPPDLIDRQIAVARELGIRFQPTRGSMSLCKKSGGLPPDDLCQDEATILADCRRLIAAHHDPAPGAMTRIDLAPCSPFSVTEDLMRQTSALAREAGVRLHTHVAETLDEERFCLERVGLRPVAYMESLGWTGPDVWYAHAVQLDDAEVRRLGETGTGVAHCPGSNMRLGSGIARVRELLDAGAPVGLAVDGSASNDADHLLAEARLMLLASRLRGEGALWLTAADVWHCATRGGAAVLGRGDVGSIEPARRADLALWDLDTLELAGAGSDPLAALLFSAAAPRVHTLLVEGEVRVADGRIPGLDERAQAARHNAAAEALLARAADLAGRDPA